MSGPPQTYYLDLGSFEDGEKQILSEYISQPARYLGPIIVGALLDHVLLGMGLSQAWIYYSRFPKDALKFRILVALLLLTNLAQTVFTFYSIYSMFAVGFGKWDVFITQVFFEVIMILEAISGSLSQLYFCERAVTLLRLWRREAGWVLLALAAPSILGGLALGIGSGILPFKATSSTDFDTFRLLTRFIISWKSVSSATDLLLTGTIVTCLTLNRTGRRSNDSLLRSVIRWTIEAQTLPLFASLFFFASYVRDPDGNLPIVPSLLEGKFALLSVLHVLNSRMRVRDKRETDWVQSLGNLDEATAEKSASDAEGGQTSEGSATTTKGGRGKVDSGVTTTTKTVSRTSITPPEPRVLDPKAFAFGTPAMRGSSYTSPSMPLAELGPASASPPPPIRTRTRPTTADNLSLRSSLKEDDDTTGTGEEDDPGEKT